MVRMRESKILACLILHALPLHISKIAIHDKLDIAFYSAVVGDQFGGSYMRLVGANIQTITLQGLFSLKGKPK